MEAAAYQEMRIFSGNAHPDLAKAICSYLETAYGAYRKLHYKTRFRYADTVDAVNDVDNATLAPQWRLSYRRAH